MKLKRTAQLALAAISALSIVGTSTALADPQTEQKLHLPVNENLLTCSIETTDRGGGGGGGGGGYYMRDHYTTRVIKLKLLEKLPGQELDHSELRNRNGLELTCKTARQLIELAKDLDGTLPAKVRVQRTESGDGGFYEYVTVALPMGITLNSNQYGVR